MYRGITEKGNMKNDPQTELIQEIQSLEPELIMRTMYPVDWQRLGEGFGHPQGYSGFQVHFMRISKVKKTIANISGTFVSILSYLPAAFFTSLTLGTFLGILPQLQMAETACEQGDTCPWIPQMEDSLPRPGPGLTKEPMNQKYLTGDIRDGNSC